MKFIVVLICLFCGAANAQQAGFTKTKTTAEYVVLQAIAGATTSIDGAIYQFTSKPILQALGDAIKRGVKVNIVIDRTNASNQTPQVLTGYGAGCRIDRSHVIMHHKFMVIDSQKVLTGSFNWSLNAATRNAENVVFVNSKALASDFKNEFERVWEKAEKCQS